MKKYKYFSWILLLQSSLQVKCGFVKSPLQEIWNKKMYYVAVAVKS